MAGSAPVVLEHPIQNKYHPYSNNSIQHTYKPEPDGWAVVAAYFNHISDVNLNRQKMAGRWLGGCPWLFPTIAGEILDRCKTAGR